MRFTIVALLVVLAGCGKEEAQCAAPAPQQDILLEMPELVTPAEDVTAAVDVSAVSAPAPVTP
jgi:hypothetical protein